MPTQDPIAIDAKSPPFDQFRSIRWLSADRSGHDSQDHVRHHLYVGRLKRNPVNLLIKLASRPGLVYQQNLINEINSLTTINRELPDSRYFPFIHEHGELDDGRAYLIATLFDEFPLATMVSTEAAPEELVSYLRITLETSRALSELHRLEIFHVDLNPMNILAAMSKTRPVIRIVDFESSYERSRHAGSASYSPPTTPGYSAPEIVRQPPDARSDLFSLGSVLHTLLAGQLWAGREPVSARVKADRSIDADLKAALLMAVDPDPDRRYASVEEFRNAVGAYLERIWPGRTW